MEDSQAVSREQPSEAQKQLQLPFSLTRNPEKDNLPAELLDEYELDGEELLGEGAFAVVRLMKHRVTGELFALKCLEKQPLKIRNMIAQMQREVRIQANLSHPNILRLLRVYDTTCYVYLLLEYCAQGPIRTLMLDLPDRRLEEPLAARYFEQIATGVAWMHGNSCVHRDLKLENMLVTDNDVVKICDFGWSAEMEIEKLLKTTCGTTAFWAPEIWESQPQDEAVDLWALGCLLYEMLAGHAPFHEQDQAALKQKVLAVEFGYPPWFSNEACHAVHILLQKDPASRVKCVDLLQHPWLQKFRQHREQPAIESATPPTKEMDSQSTRPVIRLQQAEVPRLSLGADTRIPVQAQATTPPLGNLQSPLLAARRVEVSSLAAKDLGRDITAAVSSSAGARPFSPVPPISPVQSFSPGAQAPDTKRSSPARHRLASPTRASPAVPRFASPTRSSPAGPTRFASPAQSSPAQTSMAAPASAGRPLSPMRYPDPGQGTSLMHRYDRQTSPFGCDLRGQIRSTSIPKQSPCSIGSATCGGATGSAARSYATGAFGPAAVQPCPLDHVPEHNAHRDTATSWRGHHPSLVSRQLPCASQGLAPGGTTLAASSVAQWQGFPGTQSVGGAAFQSMPAQRLPIPQPVANAQQNSVPVQSWANLASGATSTNSLPVGPVGSSYGLPHSGSGRFGWLSNTSATMVMPQQQPQQQHQQQQHLPAYGANFGTSPRAPVYC